MKLYPLPAASLTAWAAVPSMDAAVTLLGLAHKHLGAGLKSDPHHRDQRTRRQNPAPGQHSGDGNRLWCLVQRTGGPEWRQ